MSYPKDAGVCRFLVEVLNFCVLASGMVQCPVALSKLVTSQSFSVPHWEWETSSRWLVLSPVRVTLSTAEWA